VYLADWDESDAFCNIPREDTPALLDDIAPRLGNWLQRYYGRLHIRTVTPHGLTDPFPMAHGGGQGDSGGVGAYLAVGIQRTRCHRGVILRHLDPRCPAVRLDSTPEPVLRCPFDPQRVLLEIAYSDDRRPMAQTGRGLEALLNAMTHACWAAGGTVNTAKLQAFHVVMREGRLQYAPGAVRPAVGNIPLRRGGLSLAGIPLVMAERAGALQQKVEKRLRAVSAAVVRLQPTFLLAVRIVLGYAISQLDYVFSACPATATFLQPLQVLIDSILTRYQGPTKKKNRNPQTQPYHM
jgi:hypothetical protein